MRRIIFGALLALLPLLAGCGQSTPALSSARASVEPVISKKIGEVTDFRKTNGQQAEVAGVKVYEMRFRAAVKLGQGFEWWPNGFMDSAGLHRTSKGWAPADRIILPAGTTHIIKGRVSFALTERGWQVVDWHTGVTGYCMKLGPTECYTKLWGPESND